MCGQEPHSSEAVQQKARLFIAMQEHELQLLLAFAQQSDGCDCCGSLRILLL
jgi:hypothetical protein